MCICGSSVWYLLMIVLTMIYSLLSPFFQFLGLQFCRQRIRTIFLAEYLYHLVGMFLTYPALV